jgi:hypothetical protein
MGVTTSSVNVFFSFFEVEISILNLRGLEDLENLEEDLEGP